MAYDAVNAKARGMSGKLMGREDYRALASREQAAGFMDGLTAFPGYERALEGVDLEESRRKGIEQRIVLALIDDFERIYTFIGNQNQRDYLSAFFVRVETSLLKAMLCAVFDERRALFDTPEVARFLSRRLDIDVGQLAASESVGQFIENLRGTPFYGALAEHYEDGRTSLFELEMRMDVYGYMWLWQGVKKLDRDNARVMRGLVGAEIDLRNLQWIYRLKTFYTVNQAKIVSYLVPVRHRLARDTVTRLTDARDEGELLAALNETTYFRDYDGKESIEAAAQRQLNGAYKRARVNNPQTLATAAAYLHFKEQEISNLVSLLECVRYGLSAEEAESYITI